MLTSTRMRKLLKRVIRAILTWEARTILKKYKPQIIAITGNVGKTSTKDAVYAALTNSVYIRKSKKSFNSEIGVPLTIIGCDTGWNNPLVWLSNIREGLALILLKNHYPKWLVLEVGTDRPGDIEEITQWLKPDIAVVTALPDAPVHMENFKRPEDVAIEKKKLVAALKGGGTLITNGDYKSTAQLKGEFKNIRTVLYGTELHNEMAATHIEITYKDAKPTGMQFRVDSKGMSLPLTLEGRLGTQQVYPILAALAVSEVIGVELLSAAKHIVRGEGPNGRMRVLEGHNGSTIIDDSYNSSPLALRAALTTLKKVETKGKKIAVLGDMLELGRVSTEEHKKAGVQVASIADALITVGVRARDIAKSARESGFDPTCIQEFETGEAHEAGRVIRAMLEEGDVVLVKGSQSGIRLERAVKEILANPKEARSVLVRQEDHWLEM